MDNPIDSSKPIIRHQPPAIQTAPAPRGKGLGFATDEAVASMNLTDQGMASRSYNSRLLAEQYTYGNTGKHMSSATEAPPNSYSSPTTSIPMEHPVTYGMSNNPYATSSKAMSTTPTLTSTPPLMSIPHPLGEDPRHSRLPNGDVLEHLVNVYFTYVYSQTYAFLHRQTFTETLYRQPPVLIFSLCAVAARFSDRFSKYEEDFAEPARKLIFENYDKYSIEVVQSLVHMGLHDFGSNNGDKAWMFCGMAVRMGSALNLNLENGHAKTTIKSPIAREVARRTYWSYYLMDVSIFFKQQIIDVCLQSSQCLRRDLMATVSHGLFSPKTTTVISNFLATNRLSGMVRALLPNISWAQIQVRHILGTHTWALWHF